MRWIWCLLSFTQLFGATVIKGRLENGTTGGPGMAERVQLVGLGQGMEILSDLTEVEGDFEIHYDGDLSGRSWLIQAFKGAAVYSFQGGDLNETIQITIYDASPDAVITPRGGTIAISAIGQTMDIGRFINLDNQTNPPVTLERPDATFTFTLEPGFRKVDASTTRGKIPLKQQLKIEGNQASIQYPLRPGRTQLMVRTEHAYSSEVENTYQVPLLKEQTFAHILVLPQSLDIKGEGIKFVSSDDSQGVKLYEWERKPGQDQLELIVWGASADKAPETPATEAHSQQNTPEVENTPHHLDKFRWYIISGVIGLLLLISLYGSISPKS